MTITAAARAQATPGTPPDSLARPRWVAGLGALGAAGLHVAAAVDHLAAGDLMVGFFLLTALAQLGIGLWLLVGSWLGNSPGTGPLAVALAGTVLLVCLYLIAHTTDLFTGLTGHDAEAVAGTGHQAGHAAGGHHAGASIEAEGPVALDDEAPAAAEPPDLLGAATIALELLSILGLTALLPHAWRGRTLNALLALGALAWVAWLTGVLG